MAGKIPVRCQIYRHEYTLMAEPGDERTVQECAAMVDKLMTAIAGTGRIVATERVAVFAAMQMALTLKLARLDEESYKKVDQKVEDLLALCKKATDEGL